MKPRFGQRWLFAFGAFLLLVTPPAQADDATLGDFESHGDVGSPRLSGSASYNSAAQEYTLTGAGANMWSTNDQFQFLWKKMKGDFILRARVEFAGPGVVDHRKIGWMI